MNIALIVGSLRKEITTRRIAHTVRDLAPKELAFDEIPIGTLPLYNQDLETASPPREWVEFRERVRKVDGVLFATPEYSRSVPGVLKNAIDVGSRPYGKSAWAQKPCAVISVAPGNLSAFGANHHLRQSLVFLDMPCMQQPELDTDGKVVDKTRDFLREFAQAFSQWVTRYSASRAHDSAA